jgi:hypothetical protein
MRTYRYWAGLALLATAFSAACDDDNDRTSNPHYSTGGSNDTTGGTAAGDGDAGESTLPIGGDASGGVAQGGAAGSSVAGEAGQTSTPTPPYDCVLEPKTHLEIINACTDATRIEKHPDLPQTP